MSFYIYIKFDASSVAYLGDRSRSCWWCGTGGRESMGANHGEGTGTSPPEFGVRGTLMQIVTQILSCLKISNTRLLALQCIKKLINSRYSNTVGLVTVSQKYIFNVHQIISLGGKFNIFLARTQTKCTAQNASKHTISSEKFIFYGRGYAPPIALFPHLSFDGKWYPPNPTTCPHQAFWIHPASSQNSSQICATATITQVYFPTTRLIHTWPYFSAAKYYHTMAGTHFSSLGWDLLCSTHILSLKCLRLPATNK